MTTKLKTHKAIPIYIVEDHDEALAHIYRNIGSKHLPFTNNYMIHFDSHPDLSIPRSMPGHVARDRYKIFDAVSIESWILPAAYNGYINRIAWVKPPWSDQIAEGKYKFEIGDNESGHVSVNSTLDYYVSEGVYCHNLQGEVRAIELDVVALGETSGVSLTKDVTKYILDIDLDYFSTYNPFKLMYNRGGVYEELQKIFVYTKPDVKSPQSIQDTLRARTDLLNELEQLFQYLDKHRNLDNYSDTTSSNYNKVRELQNLVLNHYNDDDIDWMIMYNAGCTWDDPEHVLPHHESTEEELKELYAKFEGFIASLIVPPTVITIARSSQDNYCPAHQVEDIQSTVLSILENRFEVFFTFDYMSSED